MATYDSIGIQTGGLLLPAKNIDLKKWAVIACDQFTSQPDYWQQVSNLVGDSPSTFHMILPEVYLNTPQEMTRITSTQETMRHYLNSGVLDEFPGLILVERSVAGKIRHGLMLTLDLEKYDFNKGSQSLIRATEGTILDRLPPRIRIRQGAPLELPHILVLVDDPGKTVIEPLVALKNSLSKIYETDLMLGSGHLTGYHISSPELENQVINALETLANPDVFYPKYNVNREKGILLFAVGDGNHSLATAKSIWESIKKDVGPDHPARYALVELENVHDQGLEFEPIHRVCFGVHQGWQSAMENFFGKNLSLRTCPDRRSMIDAVYNGFSVTQCFGIIFQQSYFAASIHNPESNLPVGTLQSFLDPWLKSDGAKHMDYVHGEDVVCDLGSQAGQIGFFLPGMSKNDLFKTVILDGALPRKTFSMGEAIEKRFYMECRKIS